MKEVVSLFSVATVEAQALWSAFDEGRFALPECEACKRLVYYPRLHCPFCGAKAFRSVELSGGGTVYSFTRVMYSPFGKRWESEVPYCVAQIDLDEGVRFLSRIVGDITGLHIGERVKVEFVKVAEQERKLPFFRRLTKAETDGHQ